MLHAQAKQELTIEGCSSKVGTLISGYDLDMELDLSVSLLLVLDYLVCDIGVSLHQHVQYVYTRPNIRQHVDSYVTCYQLVAKVSRSNPA